MEDKVVAIGEVIPQGGERHYYKGAGCTLSAVTFGMGDIDRIPTKKQKAMLLVHGMKDHALSLIPLIQAFADYQIVAVDLRGHGHSDNTIGYSLVGMVADLKATVDHFGLNNITMVAHSLGGHIAARFASLYPEVIKKLVLIDGMGPPGDSSDNQDEQFFAPQADRWRDSIERLLAPVRAPRRMKDAAEACGRLLANNPLLGEAHARVIADHGVIADERGDVIWRWDAAVDMIWMTFSHAESEGSWHLIRCPVQIITGEHSLDYWSAMREHLRDQTEFYEAELARRCRLFRDATHTVIPGAGHMLHYDQPTHLCQTIRQFLDEDLDRLATG